MPIARCSLRCGSSNAFRPQQALCSLFLEPQQPLNLCNARRISLNHQELHDGRPLDKTPTADAENPIKSSSIPPSEYVNTASLQDSLNTLRRKNRETLLSQEHASSNKTAPSGRQLLEDEVDDLFSDRQVGEGQVAESQVSMNKASLPESTAPRKPTQSKAEKIVKHKRDRTAADLLEYTGMYVRPSMGEADPEQEYPWTKDIPDGLQGTARLDAEIWRFAEYIKPTSAEQAAFKAVTEDVQKSVKQWCPDYRTQVFGSQVSGLALSTSDIDLRLYDHANKDVQAAPRHRARLEINAQLKHLYDRLHRRKSGYMMVRMRQARYPLISMIHRDTGLDVQIVAGNNTTASQELIKQYLVEYPYLYANFTLFKSMLEIRGLTDVFRGGLGSYSLVMMIVAALKAKGVDAAHEHGQTSSGQPLAGKRFLDMLQFYAGIDTYKKAFSLQHPFTVDKHDNLQVSEKEKAKFAEAPHLEGLNKLSLIDHMQPYLLCLQDPADPLNDLGRKAYGWKHIQTTIKVLRGTIMKALSSDAQPVAKHSRAPIRSVLAKAVGPCFKAYETRRAITEAYGQKILEKERAEREKGERAAEAKAVAAELADL